MLLEEGDYRGNHSRDKVLGEKLGSTAGREGGALGSIPNNGGGGAIEECRGKELGRCSTETRGWSVCLYSLQANGHEKTERHEGII